MLPFNFVIKEKNGARILIKYTTGCLRVTCVQYPCLMARWACCQGGCHLNVKTLVDNSLSLLLQSLCAGRAGTKWTMTPATTGHQMSAVQTVSCTTYAAAAGGEE